MRQLIFILSLFCTAQSFGQEIELQGKYSASFLGAETIDFVGKDSFYFYGFYCTNGLTGKGRCEILNNYLYLNFEKKKSLSFIDTFHIDKIEKTQSLDSFAIFKIICLDNLGAPLPLTTVTINKKGKATIGTTSDTYGNAQLKIRKNNFPIEINVSAVGIKTKKIILTEPSNYSLKTFSENVDINEKLENGEQFIYEIEDLTEDLISMRPKNGGGPFRKYKRRKQSSS